MSETTDNNVALTQFSQLPQIAASAGEILAKNQNTLRIAKDKAQSLLDTIEASGMTPELDSECSKFLSVCTDAQIKMNTRRKPITQLFTAIAKEYTTLENFFDKTNPDTFAGKIQIERNKFAKAEGERQRQRELQIQREKAINQERVEIKARIEKAIRDSYLQTLFAFKQKANTIFNDAVLETLTDASAAITKLRVDFPRDKFDEIKPIVTAVYLDIKEVNTLIVEVRNGLYDELSANFRENMEAIKMHLTDQIPARRFELEEIAKADASQKKKLQDEAEFRQKEEALRIERENRELAKKAEQATELNKHVGEAEVGFQAENQLADVRSGANLNTKVGYILHIKSVTGWQTMAAFWFAEIGNKMPMDKFETKTFGSMKKEVEKYSFANNKMITASAHIEYETSYKAVNSKI